MGSTPTTSKPLLYNIRQNKLEEVKKFIVRDKFIKFIINYIDVPHAVYTNGLKIKWTLYSVYGKGDGVVVVFLVDRIKYMINLNVFYEDSMRWLIRHSLKELGVNVDGFTIIVSDLPIGRRS